METKNRIKEIPEPIQINRMWKQFDEVIISKEEYDHLKKIQLAYGELIAHINRDELHKTRYVKDIVL